MEGFLDSCITAFPLSDALLSDAQQVSSLAIAKSISFGDGMKLKSNGV